MGKCMQPLIFGHVVHINFLGKHTWIFFPCLFRNTFHKRIYFFPNLENKVNREVYDVKQYKCIP